MSKFFKIIGKDIIVLAIMNMTLSGCGSNKVHKFSFRRAMILEVTSQKWPAGHVLRSSELDCQINLNEVTSEAILTNKTKRIKYKTLQKSKKSLMP